MRETLKELFEKDGERAQAFTKKIEAEKGYVVVDYSKTHAIPEDICKWESHAAAINLKGRVEEMFRGEKINYTEDRAVLHTKLRSSKVINAFRKGANEGADREEEAVIRELRKMKRICDEFAGGLLKGASNKRIRNVVNIGIGGSDLGPRLLADALKGGRAQGLFFYISNVDAQEIHEVLKTLEAEETLFVVVSKTFATQETLENAKIALSWVRDKYARQQVGEDKMISCHFMGVSAAKDRAVSFGINEDNVLDMWDFVGGRYSLWGCVSLSSAMAMGFEAFLDFLEGGAAMDNHFRNEPLSSNIPMLHALIENKYINECGFNNKCVVPYDYFLQLLPAYLQQAEMESNGKSCTREGSLLIEDRASFISEGIKDPGKSTGAIVWGGVGTNVQHSYFQLLHQGTVQILAEFLVAAESTYAHKRKNTESGEGESTSHDVLVANCLAQSRALMEGRESSERERHFTGNRPSITLLYSKLTPFVLGMLIALYEHKVFVQGVLWNINSYDQFGVELGKVLAKEILGIIEKHSGEGTCEREKSTLDQSTSSLLCLYIRKRCKRESK
jgi:glucose-6-phosphate isomerase